MAEILQQQKTCLPKLESEDMKQPRDLLAQQKKLEEEKRQQTFQIEQEQEALTKLIYDSAKKTLLDLNCQSKDGKDSMNIMSSESILKLNQNLITVNKVKDTIKWEIENKPQNQYQSRLVSLYYDSIVYAEILKRQIDYGNFKLSLQNQVNQQYSSVNTQNNRNILELDFHSLIFNFKRIIEEQDTSIIPKTGLETSIYYKFQVMCMVSPRLMQQFPQFCIQEIRGFFYSLLGYFKANHKAFEIKRPKRLQVSEKTELTKTISNTREKEEEVEVEVEEEEERGLKVDIHKNLEKNNDSETGLIISGNLFPSKLDYVFMGKQLSTMIEKPKCFKTVDEWLKLILQSKKDEYKLVKVSLLNSTTITIEEEAIKQKLIGQLCYELKDYKLYIIKKEEDITQILEAEKIKIAGNNAPSLFTNVENKAPSLFQEMGNKAPSLVQEVGSKAPSLFQEVESKGPSLFQLPSLFQGVRIEVKDNGMNRDKAEEIKGKLEKNMQKHEAKDIHHETEARINKVNSNQEAQEISDQDNKTTDQPQLNQQKTGEDTNKELKDNSQSKKEDENKADLIGSVEIVESEASKGDNDVKETSNENDHKEECQKNNSAEKNESNENSDLNSAEILHTAVVENAGDINKDTESPQKDSQELSSQSEESANKDNESSQNENQEIPSQQEGSVDKDKGISQNDNQDLLSSQEQQVNPQNQA